MKAEAIREFLATYMQTNWTGDDALPIEWPNQKFKQPDGQAWCRFAPLFGKRDAADVGGQRMRTPGIHSIQIFCPENRGTQAATKAGDLLGAIFEKKQLIIESGLVLVFEVAGLVEDGERTGYKQFTASVPFYVDECP